MNRGQFIRLFLGAIGACLAAIVAGATPWVLERLFPADALRYTFDGPILTTDGMAYRVTVRNDGRSPQKDLRVTVPVLLLSRLIGLKDAPSALRTPEVKLGTTLEPTSIQERERSRVLNFSLLRPGESVSISVIVVGGIPVGVDLQSEIKVVSLEALGVYEGAVSNNGWVYRASIWGLAVLVSATILFVVLSRRFSKVGSRRAKVE